ncbi:IS66 family insertion sequence element accessory protein TnpB [Lysinibacillus pakistanensis]|uniref:IS66 family insertion sequence element accessory protein TnpB n=1 Tax=Lysinibacillus pakistanensis TaxID=759811 RepID=UPI00257D5CE7|nr:MULTISPECIES: IS66 family insertion sequence element accessory protein TnpB [Lysinibacillus]
MVCEKTDMSKGIDDLATLIQDSFDLDPYGDSVFLFCDPSKCRYKCLYFDRDGFALLYKRLKGKKLQWPKDENEVRNLSKQGLRWLLEGLSLQQSRAIKKHQKVYSKFTFSNGIIQNFIRAKNGECFGESFF